MAWFPGSPRAHAAHDIDHVLLPLLARCRQVTDGRPPEDWRVLEIGCGYHAPFAATFSSHVAAYVGVDTEEAFHVDGLSASFGAKRRQSGVLRAAKRMLIDCPYYRRYHAALALLTGTGPPTAGTVDVRTYDGRHLPFEPATFDIVFSNAVLEHVMDLPNLAKETARVLRPGGVADMVWHNYYSLSGGHQTEECERSIPWGHLRGLVRTEGLNRVPGREVAEIFAEHLSIERFCGVDLAGRREDEPGYQTEGAELLTPRLREELAPVDQPDLLTRAYMIQARRA